MLRLLLGKSKHQLPEKIQQEFPEVYLPTDHVSESGENSVHQLLQNLPVTLLDGQGQTPLSVAPTSDSSSAGEAAALLLREGMHALQPVKELSSSVEGKEGITHPLLIAAKVGPTESPHACT